MYGKVGKDGSILVELSPANVEDLYRALQVMRDANSDKNLFTLSKIQDGDLPPVTVMLNVPRRPQAIR